MTNGEAKQKDSWIERLPIKIGKYLGWITVLLIATALVIGAIKTTVPGLGNMLTAETGAPDVRQMLFVCWERSSCLTKNAKWNLWLDAIFLVPLYVVFFVCFQGRYYCALRDEDENRKPPKIFGYPLDWRFLLSLPILAGLFDQIENFSTLYALYLLPENSPEWLHWLIHKSAWAKWILVLSAAAFSLWLFCSWYFHPQRAGLRRAIEDILNRTKYAVVVILVYAILVLAMDQTQDAVVRQFLGKDSKFTGYDFIGFIVTILAIGLMACSGWYWTRVVLRVKRPSNASVDGAETFAKWWARILGVASLLISLALVFKIFQDLDAANDNEVLKEVGGLGISVFGLTVLFLLMTSMRTSMQKSKAIGRMGYYNCAGNIENAKDDLSLIAQLVFWGPLLVFVVSRLLSEIPEFPPLTFAMLSAGVAAWAGLFGWLAYESIRRTAPLLLLLVLAIAGIGLFGGSEVHEVLVAGASSQVYLQNGFWLRLGGVLVLAVILFLAVFTYLSFLHRGSAFGCASKPKAIGFFALSISMLLIAFDKGFPNNNDDAVSDRATFKDERVVLDVALQDWLKRLYESICKNHGNAEKCAQSKDKDRTPVYFVSAEGGGIRAAYWPALVLAELDKQIRVDQSSTPELSIFSISGVSGGSIGATTFVACIRKARQKGESVDACIDRLGRADLVTQTLGGVLFEDAIASILPTSWICTRPGCALFGRSYWFEGRLEAEVQALREATMLKPLGGHLSVPHVFLNATRVENGQRAIASTVRVNSDFFPGASDQVTVLSNDIRFSTAGHNSARFPYVNPVATAFGYGCPKDKPLLNKLDSRKSKRELCGHWVDGGYLDNSGAITTADILRAFRGCLGKGACAGGLSNKTDKKENEAEDQKIRSALRKRLVPIVLSIRNGIPQRKDCLNGQACIWKKTHVHDMAEHRPAAPWRLLTNALAPLIAIGQSAASHAPLGEAKLKLEAEQLWRDFGLSSTNASIATTPVRQIDQINDGKAIYPLGWMLSSRAQKQMQQQARNLSRELFQYNTE